MSMTPELLRRIVEGALLAAAQPLSEDRLLSLFDEEERPEKAALIEVLEAIAESGEGRGFELRQVASGWRFQVPEDLAPWVNKLWEEKPQKYSRATLETLAIIAYRQPITRGDIEEIRGVAVSSHIVKSLTERGWIKVVGQRDVPGKPSLYATTREFLDYFNLRSLDDLPTLAEIRDIESLTAALDLGDATATPGEQAEVLLETDDEAGEQAPESEVDSEREIEREPALESEDAGGESAAENAESVDAYTDAKENKPQPDPDTDYAETEPEADSADDLQLVDAGDEAAENDPVPDESSEFAPEDDSEMVAGSESDIEPEQPLNEAVESENEERPSGETEADEPQVRENLDT